MKAIYILAVLSLGSCTKDWECQMVLESVNVNSTYYVDFRGTKQEKDVFEQEGNTTTHDGQGGDIVITTTCYPD